MRFFEETARDGKLNRLRRKAISNDVERLYLYRKVDPLYQKRQNQYRAGTMGERNSCAGVGL